MGETGFLVDSGDVAGLGEAIARLAADGDLRLRLGVAGLARVRLGFSTEAHVKRMEAIFREVASR